jgi:hypothetical protein|tara:strand:+ start:803 stop:1450 length:648 start_codon:yes stop_codon:yes gene_type:complete
MANIDDSLFNKAVNETSFAIPDTGAKKAPRTGDKAPLVSGDYLGHIVQVNSKVVDVLKGKYKARVYDYFVEVAPENKINKYTYTRYDDDKVVDTDGSAYVGYKFKGSIFKYLEPGEGDTFESRSEFNKYYMWFCEACGIECPTITTKIDGEEMEVKSLPEINMESLVGTPVQGVIGKGKTWTDSDGKERTPWVVKFVRNWKDGQKKEMTDEDIPF